MDVVWEADFISFSVDEDLWGKSHKALDPVKVVALIPPWETIDKQLINVDQ